jgi:iron complex outermembrane receptor protein
MRSLSLLLVLLAAGLAAAAAARSAPFAPSTAVTGLVRDASGEPIAGVGVAVVELRRGADTGADGRFSIPSVPYGVYHISFQRLGYAPEVRHFEFGPESAPLEVRLRVSLIEDPGTQVTASPKVTTSLDSPQPVGILTEEELRTAQQPSLGATVERLPGLRNWSTGVGIGKPAIRGLRSDRVLVVADGQRLENQQWGDEHGPQVETYAVERVEVIRGPASVLYGSDALGGVVNVITRELPTAFDRSPFVTGWLTGAYGSVDARGEGGISLEGASGGVGFRGGYVGREGGDVETPDGALFNSGNESHTAGGTLGWRGAWGSAEAGYVYRQEHVEIHEDPAEDPTATPYQKIDDDLAHLRLLLPTGRDQRLEVNAAFEQNFRREYEAADAADVALGLQATTWSGSARYAHPALGELEGVVGAALLTQDFEKSGEETLIPNSSEWDLGVFAFEQLDRDSWHLSFGLRYDHRELDAEEDADLGVSAQTRRWDAVTGNLGMLRRLGESMAAVLNLGRGFRAPSSFDLFANGVHEGTVAYEVGDSALDVEHSFNVDVGLRLVTGATRLEVIGFWNSIQDYIYSRPTGTFDPGSGFEIYQTVQGDARLYGVEAEGDWHPERQWHVFGSADYVVGDNTSVDQPLPWVPPFRVLYGIRWEPDPFGRGVESYVGLRGESNARQTRLDPADYGPEGYTVFQLEAGIGVPLGARRLDLDLAMRNLFDEAHQDFMSRYKTYALAPGRGLVARLTARF